jgi:4-hydroxy-tetrahydrodipicolinate reductase
VSANGNGNGNGAHLEDDEIEVPRALRVALHGATGRMGLAVARLAHLSGMQIVGAIASRHSEHLGRDIGDLAGVGSVGVAVDAHVPSGLLGADVVIDFSRHDAVGELAHAASHAKVAIVCGTTRLSRDSERLLEEASQIVPVLWAPNMSIGVNVLVELVKTALAKLGPGYDIEIVETHHRAKIDSPSGTAIRLVEAAREGRSAMREVRGRDGNVGPRKSDEIGVVALRGGDVIGDHTVHLLGNGERLELTHRATNRDLFAHGALVAARYITGKPARRYAISEVV